MDLREEKGCLFDYNHRYTVLVMMGTMENAECKAELDEQARLFKNMNELYDKFVSATPCADQTGTGYFFFVPFNASLSQSSFATLSEALMIMREVGAENVAIKVCGTEVEKDMVRSFLAEYDRDESPLGDVLLLV